MSRPVLAPLVVALSALLVVPQIQAEPTAPLFVVEQQRSALVTRLAKQWSDAFAVLPKERRLDHEQLSSALFALRADRLFAVTLAGDVDAVESVLSDAKRDAVKPRVAAKALGDATADLTYTPVNPCRILDTRSTVAGPLAPNVARTFDGYSVNFATQGGTGSGCGIPNGVAALAMNVYAVNPTNLGFIKVWPANAAEPAVSTVNYQDGIIAIATGALVPVDAANSNRFTAKSPATVDFIADVVGYFKPPGDATSLDIKVAGQRVMRYEYNAISPNAIGGSPANSASAGIAGVAIAGGGKVGTQVTIPWIGVIDCAKNAVTDCANRVTDLFGTVAGGLANQAGGTPSGTSEGRFATVGGGQYNIASGAYASLGGGVYNAASGSAATIAGGQDNIADAQFGSVLGGFLNRASGLGSTIVGGSVNIASGNFSTVGGTSNSATDSYGSIAGGGWNVVSGPFGTVLGGYRNVAAGAYSIAAGRHAKTHSAGGVATVHPGAFVWADSNDFDFNSTTANELAARATGGVRFVTAIDGTGLPTWTCGVSGGAGGSWGCSSDRNFKTDLVPLDGIATLERLATLPVYQWVAKDDPRRIPHAGPTAQDFMAAFGLGDNDKMIGFADAQGVAFAAIQGLNTKFDAAISERDARIVKQDQEIAELKRAVEVLLTRTSPEGRMAEGR